MIAHARPSLRREAAVPAGAIFVFRGRPLRVHQVRGNKPNSVVICEELTAVGNALPGQFAMWSLRAVRRALSNFGGGL